MAISLAERPESREWSGGTVTFRYWLKGTSDDVAAYAYLLANTAATYEGLTRQTNVTCEPVPTTIDSDNDKGVWECSVQYGTFQGPSKPESEVGTVRIRIDTTGGTMHLTQSEGTKEYGPGGSCGFNGAIGVSPDRQSIEGVDIIVPVFNFTVSKVWSKANIPSYNTLYTLTGKVNSSSFSVTDTETGKTLTFDAGECLFNGTQVGDLRTDGGIEITYSFSAYHNKTNFTVPHTGITVASKKGWEYIWTAYYLSSNASNQVLLKAQKIFVEEVYETANLSSLNI